MVNKKFRMRGLTLSGLMTFKGTLLFAFTLVFWHVCTGAVQCTGGKEITVQRSDDVTLTCGIPVPTTEILSWRLLINNQTDYHIVSNCFYLGEKQPQCHTKVNYTTRILGDLTTELTISGITRSAHVMCSVRYRSAWGHNEDKRTCNISVVDVVTTAPENDGDKNDSSTYITVIIVCGAVTLGISVLVIIIIKRCRQRGSANQNVGSPDQERHPQEGRSAAEGDDDYQALRFHRSLPIASVTQSEELCSHLAGLAGNQ